MSKQGFLFCGAIGLGWVLPLMAWSEVVLDGSLGRSDALSGPRYVVGAELGRQVDANLFHSFHTLNLSQGESATFSGPGSVANIIGRVTGGPSTIDGLLQSTIPGANLFLINPNGMMFGPHASLDVSGSFYASTASYLKLADGNRFDATGGGESRLTAAPPAAFGFVGGNMGSLTLSGSRLEVGATRGIVLAGGGMQISGNGSLSAPSGRIGLYAVAGSGELGLDGEALPQGVRPSLGKLEISGGERVSASGSGGRVVIRSGQLQVKDSFLLSQSSGVNGGVDIRSGEVVLDGAVVQSATDSAERGGNVRIEAGKLSAVNGSEIDSSTFGRGEGGTISVQVSDLELKSGSRIANSVTSSASGHGGDTGIIASGTILVEGDVTGGERSFILNNTQGSGNAGTLRIGAGRLLVSGGSIQSATDGTGNAGTILIDSGEVRLERNGIIHALSLGKGNAGTIEVNASHIVLTEGGQFNTEARGGGKGGSIRVRSGVLDISDGGKMTNRTYYFQSTSGEISVNARETIRLAGRSEPRGSDPDEEVSTGIFSFTGNLSVTAPEITVAQSAGISTRTWNDLPSGDLSVNAARLTLLSGGHVSADAIGSSLWNGGAGKVSISASESVTISGEVGGRRSGIQSATRSSGDAGSIAIETPALLMSNGGMINTSTGVFGSGAAGNIEIRTGVLDVLSDARILSSSVGYGGKGNISIEADSVRLDHGAISAFGSRDGAAGRISLHAPQIIMKGGLINTESGGYSRAGDILLEAQSLLLSDGSRIKSDSSGRGDAGHVVLNIDGLFQADRSTVTTGAADAGGGNIDLRARSVALRNQSAITASVGGGSGDGGNVVISADGFAAAANSDITARADQGHGGRIAINSNVFLRTGDVDLDASSNVSGNEGVVEVNAPQLDISGSLVVLPASYLDRSGLINDPCVASRNGAESSFISKGRGAVPPGPGGIMTGVF
ncbi:MAG: filamentous hemagglutinin N-terminal domain-containing protein [Sulfuricella denitrificans]|nr:filamentous hemagglutinin N-terminal domain-containing protein [Sulfuricella denitrificans]